LSVVIGLFQIGQKSFGQLFKVLPKHTSSFERSLNMSPLSLDLSLKKLTRAHSEDHAWTILCLAALVFTFKYTGMKDSLLKRITT
jgi:hypothetical protein